MPNFFKRNFIHFNFLLGTILQIGCIASTPQEDALNGFRGRFIKEICRDYGLGVYGVGVSWPKKIEIIKLYFEADCFEQVEGARRRLVPIAERFIEMMNEDENLLPFLANCPATVNNIHITLAFKTLDRTDCLDCVMLIGAKEKIYYFVLDEKGNLQDAHEETFEQALEIVKQEQF